MKLPEAFAKTLAIPFILATLFAAYAVTAGCGPAQAPIHGHGHPFGATGYRSNKP